MTFNLGKYGSGSDYFTIGIKNPSNDCVINNVKGNLEGDKVTGILNDGSVAVITNVNLSIKGKQLSYGILSENNGNTRIMNAFIKVSSDSYADGVRNHEFSSTTVKDVDIEVVNLTTTAVFGIFNTSSAKGMNVDGCVVKTPDRTQDRSVRNDSGSYKVFVGTIMLKGTIDTDTANNIEVVGCYDEAYDAITDGSY